MAWPEIVYVELPNGRTVTVCAPHQMVTCGKCCLDFSDDYSDNNFLEEDGFNDEDELFGYDLNSMPREVSVAQVASSRHGRPVRSAPESLKTASIENVEDGKSDSPLCLANPFFLCAVFPKPSESENKSNITEARPYPYAPEKTKHSGIVFASRFSQHNKTPLSPESLFPTGHSVLALPAVTRFINRDDASECLIYTDGACSDNGAANARGGCAFIFKPICANDQSGSVAFKLEDRGPDGQVYRHTSNRAELRAVIAALRFRAWYGEGFKSIVIATDSAYVVDGATDWTRAWIKKGWRLTTGKPVKNRDLWEALLLDVEKLHDRNVKVRFWKIPRQSNNAADRAAKRAASTLQPTEEFTDIMGVLV
ncbi:ribonuclease H2 subunit A [Colletotrichum spaethianum]|uniref:ribonuclease H n=1 Tax=Colletotrichum spaethianum TaxID=700344 RepID=A0AA37PH27_9PEZI|nr:ribonuclease H2 subunit A [Colletotrichum spaethianum]GKT52099.1 ribonuclease H2 subunit A [Colletotrichum spaethianum]